jgi:hypothetical protein
MGAGSGAKPELPGASLEVLGRENGRSTTAIEQIPFKKNLRNPKKTRVASFSNLSVRVVSPPSLLAGSHPMCR